MKLLVVFCLAVCVTAIARPGGNWEKEWRAWKLTYEKEYAPEEEFKRQATWEQNLHIVTKHNYEFDIGLHTYQLGMNKFADMDAKEFKALYLSERRVGINSICTNGSFFNLDSGFAIDNNTVDWREEGYVTHIKDQGQCGSCWAFSATGSLEGQHFKKNGKLVSLSEQNLVDCSGSFGNLGCLGGEMDFAFAYIQKNGIDTEESYPYTAKDGSCKYDPKKVAATLKGCVDLPSKSEMALKSAVKMVGPVSVAIDAAQPTFQLYKSGIYYEPKCSEETLDHGVLAVGYGTDLGSDYWIVKNSWGLSWGIKGYIKMARNRNNNCGIATQASYPVV